MQVLRDIYSKLGLFLILAGSLASCHSNERAEKKAHVGPPNILFVIADDQSYPYASAYGTSGIHTPAFDEVAKAGILFQNAFAAAPQCSPSRAAILTGKNIWQLEEAGTHSSYFPNKFQVFTDLLEANGYFVGFTGKPWAPGNWKDAGWKRNPVGPGFNSKELEPETKDIAGLDYFGNFVDFMNKKASDQPFFFWFGSYEPHRSYVEGSGRQKGIKLAQQFVPSFLPDDSVVRSDIADYVLEIEWYDAQLKKMIDYLKEKGEWENTLVVVTADNGMSFPSAKANVYDYGTHVPLAISWPEKIKKGQNSDELVSLIDLAPTFLQVAGVQKLPEMTGRSMTDILFNTKEDSSSKSHRSYVLTGRERHTHARPEDFGYPSRAIRTDSFLYILNLHPERWPAGDPAPEKEAPIPPGSDYKPIGKIGFKDIDDPCPTKNLMMEHPEKWPALYSEGFALRPEEQLFDLKNDPGCTQNLAGKPAFKGIQNKLSQQLKTLLSVQGDPRMLGNGDIFESYPRFGGMRNFPGFKERGKYNPAFQQKTTLQ